jgi:hypothetical protein
MHITAPRYAPTAIRTQSYPPAEDNLKRGGHASIIVDVLFPSLQMFCTFDSALNAHTRRNVQHRALMSLAGCCVAASAFAQGDFGSEAVSL